MPKKKKITFEALLERANSNYALLKAKKRGLDQNYTAPELQPKIESDQVKAMGQALIELINER